MRGQLAVMNEPLRGDVLGASRRAFSAVLFDLPSPSYAALPRSVENWGERNARYQSDYGAWQSDRREHDWIIMVELAGDGSMANLHFGAGDRIIRVSENLEQVYELMQANGEAA